MDYFELPNPVTKSEGSACPCYPQMEVKSDVNHRTVCTPSATAQYYFLTKSKVM